jgi:catechol-2,3-dioxygenase
MHTVGLDHLVLNAKDVERMIAFYRDILGLEICGSKSFTKGKSVSSRFESLPRLSSISGPLTPRRR